MQKASHKIQQMENRDFLSTVRATESDFQVCEKLLDFKLFFIRNYLMNEIFIGHVSPDLTHN